MKDTQTRRAFFQTTLLGALVAPFVLKAATALASDTCPTTAPAGKTIIRSDEGMGKSLDYVADATTSKNAKYKPGSNCANCKFFNTSKLEGGYAPCTMLGMKYVSACGWCKTYLIKT